MFPTFAVVSKNFVLWKYCDPETTQACRQEHCIKGIAFIVIQAQNERVKLHVNIRILWCPVRPQSEWKKSEYIRLYWTYMNSAFIEYSLY
jgi:hypothetical protein